MVIQRTERLDSNCIGTDCIGSGRMDPICPEDALKPGTTVGSYKITRVIGVGGFGIVYAAEHTVIKKKAAIKEFFPRDLVRREKNSRVVPKKTRTDDRIQWALDKFKKEAITLSELDRNEKDPKIVRVLDYIPENNTGYMVMEFEDARPLSKILEERETENKKIGEDELKRTLFALFEGLERIHNRQIWHRDIKPDNILIRKNGSPVLIDFGAARQELPGLEKSIISQFTPHYAAPEQIYGGEQGPWTDIYALGATLYRLVTGAAPSKNVDEFIPAVQSAKGDYSRAFLAAIDAALHMANRDRPQSIAAWRKLFSIDHTLENLRPFSKKSNEWEAREEKTGQEESKVRLWLKSPYIYIAAITIIAILLFPKLKALIDARNASAPPVPLPAVESTKGPPSAGKTTETSNDTVAQPDPTPPVSNGYLVVEADPQHSKIRIIGSEKSYSNAMALSPGDYTIRVSAKDHEPKDLKVHIQANETTRTRLKLIRIAFTNSLGMQFVRVSAGRFMMGSPSREPGRSSDEERHWVKIKDPFFMQQTEVTVGQFKKFVESTGYRTEAEKGGGCWVFGGGVVPKIKPHGSWRNPGMPGLDDRFPVTCLTWNDASAFARWLSDRGGKPYRLPSEAQWEYACRAGTLTPFYTGNCLSTDEANFRKPGSHFQKCASGFQSSRGRLVAAGTLKPNPLKLFNMHGNVSEWCRDWFTEDSTRVTRGGHWNGDAALCRSARRGRFPATFASDVVGFRLVVGQ